MAQIDIRPDKSIQQRAGHNISNLEYLNDAMRDNLILRQWSVQMESDNAFPWGDVQGSFHLGGHLHQPHIQRDAL